MVTSATHAPLTRSGGLDAVRAIGALLVFAFHAQHATSLDLGIFGQGGTVGVLLFFALSGYLLYRPFLAGDVAIGRYAIRRLVRIYPAYLFALVGVAALTGTSVLLAHPLTFILFGQNYDLATISPAFLGASWTLVLEMTFYATLPVIAWLARGRELRVVLGLGLGSLVLRAIAWALVGDLDEATAFAVMALYPVMFVWFVPGLVAAILEARGVSLRRWWRAGVALIVAGLAVSPEAYGIKAAGGMFVIGGLTATGSLLVLAAAEGWQAPRPLAWFGDRLSYAFYLWHGEVFGLAAALAVAAGLRPDPATIPIAFALSVLVATVSAYGVERPAMRLALLAERRRGLVTASAR